MRLAAAGVKRPREAAADAEEEQPGWWRKVARTLGGLLGIRGHLARQAGTNAAAMPSPAMTDIGLSGLLAMAASEPAEPAEPAASATMATAAATSADQEQDSQELQPAAVTTAPVDNGSPTQQAGAIESRVKRAQEELAAKAPFKRFLQAVTGEQASDSEAEDPDLPIGLANTAYQQRSGIQHSAHGMHSADSIEHQLDLPAADVGAGDSLPAGCEEAEAAVDEEDEDMDIPKEDADLCNGQVGDDTDDRSSGRSSPNSPICTQPDAPASTPAQPRAARHFLHGRSTGVFFSLHPDGTAGMGVPDEQASGSPYYKGVDQGSSLHAGPPLGADLGASETDDDLVDDEVDRAEVAGSAEETPSGLIEEPDSPTDSQEPEQAGQQEGKVAVVKEVAGAAGRAWPDLYDFYEDSEEDMPLVQDENGVIDLTVAA
ncbi:hypothetical protein WJX72_007226 [[Myrmecia] bisecta]|uniref:Uncharacterized protein n=1 Tax=[Myrmecia] bisecta TaxID=41462 RepID=A0AAW1R738_9CHLO